MDDTPDITELLETIANLRACLFKANKYLEHPDVSSMPFVVGSSHVAGIFKEQAAKASDVLERSGYA